MTDYLCLYGIVSKALETYEKKNIEVEVWEVSASKCNGSTGENRFDLGRLGVVICKQHQKTLKVSFCPIMNDVHLKHMHI